MDKKYYNIRKIYIADILTYNYNVLFNRECKTNTKFYKQIYEISIEDNKPTLKDIFGDAYIENTNHCYNESDTLKIDLIPIKFYLREEEKGQIIISYQRLKEIYFEINHIQNRSQNINLSNNIIKIKDYKKSRIRERK